MGGGEEEFRGELWDVVRRVAALIPGAPARFIPAEDIELLTKKETLLDIKLGYSSSVFPPPRAAVKYKVKLGDDAHADVKALYVDEHIKLLEVEVECGVSLNFTLATIYGDSYAVVRAEPGALRQFKECWEKLAVEAQSTL